MSDGKYDILHINVQSGFACLNDENDYDCADFEVRFCCPIFKTGECTAPSHSWTGWYNDEWDKKNEKLWVSARQELETLQAFGEGAACTRPSHSEVKISPFTGPLQGDSN